jgi:HKD family nuclease
MKLLSTPAAITAEFNRLIKRYAFFDWAVAWASIDFPVLELLKKHRSKIRRIVVGTHFHQTHPEFIKAFSNDSSVRFRTDEKGLSGVFHPKVYLFSNNESSWEAVIGSPNFTKAAFKNNIECAVLLTSKDQTDTPIYHPLLRQVEEFWSAASQVTEDTLAAYRLRWKRNQARLAAARGHDDQITRKTSIYNCPRLNLDWAEYLRQLRNSPNTFFEDRLRMLDGVRQIFARQHSLNNMTPEERKRICGTAVERGIKWRLFGSMTGAINFKKRIKDKDQHISDALDLIPLTGPVLKAHFDGYIREFRQAFITGHAFQGLAIATRLPCTKRPDYFVCIDGKNKAGLLDALGLRPSKLTLDTYWDAIVEPIMDSPWWVSNPPPDAQDKAVWDARAAMLDALFYKP